MKPLIKWPGGKSREYPKFSDHIPKFDRYFEPFFGGGGVYFKLEPAEGYANDIDTKLVSFYQSVKTQDPEFFTELDQIKHDWMNIESLTVPLSSFFMDNLLMSVNELTKQEDLKTRASSFFNSVRSKLSSSINLEFGDFVDFESYLSKSFVSKVSRIARLQIKHDTEFDTQLMEDHLLTAVKSAYYTFLRDHYFNTERNTDAVFYFIREFCYGSMFRFNKQGKYNIPYGGINYNQKDFSKKIERLTKQHTISLLDRLEIRNLDFAEFLSLYEFDHSDFIFLDPPYDSDFKNYAKNPFGPSDQERLRDKLQQINAQWMLIIQDSELIRDLYLPLQDDGDVTIASYDKSYTYNVRGRNVQDASHLMITNYQLSQTNIRSYFD